MKALLFQEIEFKLIEVNINGDDDCKELIGAKNLIKRKFTINGREMQVVFSDNPNYENLTMKLNGEEICGSLVITRDPLDTTEDDKNEILKRAIWWKDEPINEDHEFGSYLCIII